MGQLLNAQRGAARRELAGMFLDLYDLLHMAEHGNGPVTMRTLARIRGTDLETAERAFSRIRHWLARRRIRFERRHVPGEQDARLVFDRMAIFRLLEDEIEDACQLLAEQEEASLIVHEGAACPSREVT
jgi:hypothetical protein